MFEFPSETGALELVRAVAGAATSVPETEGRSVIPDFSLTVS